MVLGQRLSLLFKWLNRHLRCLFRTCILRLCYEETAQQRKDQVVLRCIEQAHTAHDIIILHMHIDLYITSTQYSPTTAGFAGGVLKPVLPVPEEIDVPRLEGLLKEPGGSGGTGGKNGGLERVFFFGVVCFF